MVYRIFVEKKEEFAHEAIKLKSEIRDLLQIKNLNTMRIVNRYDVENVEKQIFDKAIHTVFSEPQTDTVYTELNIDEGQFAFAVEYLPGQFDQRANSAAECIQIISKRNRPEIRTAKVYLMEGSLTEEEINTIKKYVINPVEAVEASLDTLKTLKMDYEIPKDVEQIEGFNEMKENRLEKLTTDLGLAMDISDLAFCQKYFAAEKRNPTVTEIKVIDTYWSDHCRHTTFNTTIDSIKFNEREVEEAYEEYIETRKFLERNKPITLMDMGTLAAKYLKNKGLLDKLDESEEVNACTIKIDVEINGKTEKWLLLFKNETHNHPTEIEPFGGAATCIGGAIRDPLSGRSYVYAAMRVTGAADPLKPVGETLKGKLPQRKIVTTAANGYSSYGNQIGLATGQVDEIYHDGYVAKRMEIGAVIAATPEENVVRKQPEPGDIVILLGGKTGRDGCGGATGSSKPHTLESLETCGAEVQKGNAPEERKLQRLFRNPEASKMIKRCNDFGAGGVSVAIGELASGLEINLNAVPKKYDGLDGTELAISESQERMAVVVSEKDADEFCKLAHDENLEASIVAKVTAEPYLRLNWNDKTIVNISRQFLDTNGAEKHIDVEVPKSKKYKREIFSTFSEEYTKLAGDLNACSKRGLSERFDSTIGAGTVLMPFGGKYQRTPIQAMANLISVENSHTNTCSVMSWGYNPFISSANPYQGAYLAVVESISKLVAVGASFKDIYLSFQEYFEKPNRDPKRWGKPVSAVLGAFKAQRELGVAAIGGKDSMSGTFEDIDVPPTLVSFAVTTEDANNVMTPEFKGINHKVIMLIPDIGDSGLPTGESLKNIYSKVHEMFSTGVAISGYTPTYGGVAEAVLKMSMGNNIGFKFNENIEIYDIFRYSYGSFIIELSNDANLEDDEVIELGTTLKEEEISLKTETIALKKLYDIYENKLEEIYPCKIETDKSIQPKFSYYRKENLVSKYKITRPKVLIPVFPGTNCEYDSKKAFIDAGAETEIFVLNNLTPSDVENSISQFAQKVRESQIIFLPGGFSGGDEPDGSAKFIASFFRNKEIKDAVTELIEERKGLMLGICNGFQALIKLGLVPFGKIIDTDEFCPTLTFNQIGRHQSKLVRTRIASNKSPWLINTTVDDIYTVAISHGEGRFIAEKQLIEELADNGQIITQYVDLDGNVSNDIEFNPNGSYAAIEGITSPDGRILGKMGHSERIGKNLYKNVSGKYDMQMFKAAVDYFKK